MINPWKLELDKNDNAKFVYNIDRTDRTLTQIHTVLDVSDPNEPKAIKSFVDEYAAMDYADEYYLKENHDCKVVPSYLNLSLDETNY